MELLFQLRGAPNFKATRTFTLGIPNNEQLGGRRRRKHGGDSAEFDRKGSPVKGNGGVGLSEQGSGDDGLLPLVGEKVGLTNAEHCLRRHVDGVGVEEPCLVDGGDGGELVEMVGVRRVLFLLLGLVLVVHWWNW